jgi:pyrimidine-nucleoside phosphorylase
MEGLIMRMYDIIEKKRYGGVLSSDEIKFFVNSYNEGWVPDYQMSALLMAIHLKGMTDREIADLAMALALSGDTINLAEINGIKVDKFSTGGVGDKTAMIISPIVASCGVPVAKLSGRGLRYTGGTIDKYKTIPGFQVSMSIDDFISNVKNYGIAICCQTKNYAPVDKKLYALRDVTAMVDDISLTASSIMCRRIAYGSDGFLMDIKAGKGTFMKTSEDAFRLAEVMVSTLPMHLFRHFCNKSKFIFS